MEGLERDRDTAQAEDGVVRAGSYHVPVMLDEVMALLVPPRPDALMLDCTLGAGGHALAFLSKYPELRYAGIDADPEARERARARLEEFSGRLEILPGYFDETLASIRDGTMKVAAGGHAGFAPDLVLFDLGLSTHHYRDAGRGFSFAADEPLDMRLSPDAERTARDIVNDTGEKDLADLIFRYGEERYSRRIAKAIAAARKIGPITGSARLADIVRGAVPAEYRHGRIHPATRTFQAIRIAVNDELGRVERGLQTACAMLAPGGVLAVITFHSLEDRIAKTLFREKCAQGEMERVTRKPVVPATGEIAENPPSRSAKLRAVRKPAAGEAHP